MKKIFATIILALVLIPQLAVANDDAKYEKNIDIYKKNIDTTGIDPNNQKQIDAATAKGIKEQQDAAAAAATTSDTTTDAPAADKTETIPTAPTSGSSQTFDLNALRIEQGSGTSGISQGTSFFNRKDANGDPVSPITAFILTAIEFLTKIIGSVAFLILIVSGIWMIVTVGNETQVNKAKDMILYAIIGIAVAFGSYLIVTFVQGLLIQ